MISCYFFKSDLLTHLYVYAVFSSSVANLTFIRIASTHSASCLRITAIRSFVKFLLQFARYVIKLKIANQEASRRSNYHWDLCGNFNMCMYALYEQTEMRLPKHIPILISCMQRKNAFNAWKLSKRFCVLAINV